MKQKHSLPSLWVWEQGAGDGVTVPTADGGDGWHCPLEYQPCGAHPPASWGTGNGRHCLWESGVRE